MAFGWSFPKLMVVLVLGFFLLGLPLLALVAVIRERDLERRRKTSREDREPRGR